MKKIILLSLLFSSTVLFSQHRTFHINWNIPKKITSIRPDALLLFEREHYEYTPNGIFYIDFFEDSATVNPQSVKIKNIKYSPINAQLIKKMGFNIHTAQFIPEVNSAYSKNKIITGIRVNALIKKGHSYFKLDSFELEYKYSPHQISKKQNTQIYDSPWATGNWYRFKIKKSGVYKLDKKFMKDLGIDVENTNPDEIKIYGNGARLMPLPNDEFFPEDITEVAVRFYGDNNGHFDDNEYFLFYAQGPEWSEENDTNLNIYTDNFYYFIQTEAGMGKRMNPYMEPVDAVNNTYTDYLSYAYYEKDETNFTRMGRKFYEKPFPSSDYTKNIEFNFPGLVQSKPVSYVVKGATDYKGTTAFRVEMNGQYLGQAGLSFSGDIQVGDEEEVSGNVLSSSEKLHFSIKYLDYGNFDARFYLNYVNVSAYVLLQGIGKQFVFYNPQAWMASGTGMYEIQQADKIKEIWNITDIYNPTYLENNQSSISFKFTQGVEQKFMAVDVNDYFLPEKLDDSKMNNQNLHRDVFYHSGTFVDPEMLIITPSFLHNKAEELAEMHRAQNQPTYVADLEKIYNEFGTGSQDIAAIRNFIKYVYNNASAPSKKIKYVLMFGDASVDYKGLLSEYEVTGGENSNIVPIYQALDDFSLVYSYCSDDFFALMDNNEGRMSSFEQPDIAMGRFIIRNEEEANVLINKYRIYFSETSMRPWRTDLTLWADDWDKSSDNFVLNVEQEIASGLRQYHPEFNIHKLYMDAYVQEQTPGGPRYPQAKRDLLNLFEKGSLVIGFIGHGNEQVLTHERMLEMSDVLKMRNLYRLPLFTTLTCEFGRFDNPSEETTAEHMLWNPEGGALSLVTTVREIWISSADAMNTSFYKNLFGLSTGLNGSVIYNPAEALRITKVNNNYNVKFSLAYLGDPGFELAIPRSKIVLTKVNNMATDTLRALQKVKIEGEVQDLNGQLITDFNGKVYPRVFDKFIHTQTLNNDGQGQVVYFDKLGRKIFNGKSSVLNGKFSFEFVVPRDITISFGHGRISFYGENSMLEKNGFNESIIIGGVDANAEEDNIPPIIKAYLNTTDFVDGDITDPNPYLLLELEDEHGINTVGGVGHDLMAILDNQEEEAIILNDYYEADDNTYKKGKVKYRLLNLEPGWHHLKIKAWDVYNNSSETEINFKVVSSEKLVLDKVLNYPNPFINYTEFWFTHNHPFEDLDVMIQVYTITGKLVWSHRQNIYTTGFLSREIQWDGRDHYGNKLAKGVYIYKLSVRTQGGKTAKKIEKLVIL
jgi:hypothetical protein